MCSIKLLVAVACLAVGAYGALSQGDKNDLVEHHNQLRRKVAKGQIKDANGQKQPTAGDMREVKWDNGIAANAQRHANKCAFQHSSSSDRQGAGENIAQGTYGAYTIVKLSQMWFDEIVSKSGGSRGELGSGSTYCKFGNSNTPGVIGHYTQFVWSSMSKIGCGQAKCGSNNFLVCQYGSDRGKGGNMMGASIYNPGKPCEFCNGGCNDGLCTKAAVVSGGECRKSSGGPTRPAGPCKAQPAPTKDGSYSVATDGSCSAFDQAPSMIKQMFAGSEKKYRGYEQDGMVVTITYQKNGGSYGGGIKMGQ